MFFQAYDRDIYKNVDAEEIKAALVAAGLQNVHAARASQFELSTDGGDKPTEGHAFFKKHAPAKMFGPKEILALQGTKPE